MLYIKNTDKYDSEDSGNLWLGGGVSRVGGCMVIMVGGCS